VPLWLDDGVPVWLADRVPLRLELGVSVALPLGVPVCDSLGVPLPLALGVPVWLCDGVPLGDGGGVAVTLKYPAGHCTTRSQISCTALLRVTGAPCDVGMAYTPVEPQSPPPHRLALLFAAVS
jgi:hypothetical protein